MKVVIENFVRENFFKKNPELSENEVLTRIEWGWENRRQGYRDGVYLVPIDSHGFKQRVRKLVDGDHLFGQFKGRTKDEQPRKASKVLHVGELPEARFVDAIVYHRDVLNESEDKHRDYDYEVVGFLTKDTDEDEPMETEVLLHNHFQSDGGTDTKMSNDEFIAALKRSFKYWKSRAHIY